MGDINQKECIHINCSKRMNIFYNHYRYPVIGEGEKYNGPAEKWRRLRVNIPRYGPFLKIKTDQSPGIKI